MVPHASAILGLAPGPGLRGSARVPGSKSIAQRALVLAGLCGGTTRLAGVPRSADVAAARTLVGAAGARVRTLAPAALAVDGLPPGPERGWRSQKPLVLGESGTLARLATAVASLCARSGAEHELVPRGSLARRSSPALFRTLRACGVRTEPGEALGWPVRVHALGPPSELALEDPGSSQEVSALLVALAAWPGEFALAVRGPIPSRPYLELTVSVLEHFGVRVESLPEDDVERFRLRGGLRAPEQPLTVEPDASAAAVALAAGCLSGGAIEVGGLGTTSRQGDVRVIEHLARFGCVARAEPRRLIAGGQPGREVLLDLSSEPDLAPVLAAVAAAHAWRGGEGSLLTGLSTLPGKESSRIEVLASGFEACGIACEPGPDFLRVGPRHTGVEQEAVLDAHGDHRMVFAFALLGLVRPGVYVRGAQCVDKSWPGFWAEMERLGARVERRG